MDFNSLKSFAKEARKELIRTISFKMRFILSKESSAKRENPQAVKELEKKISLLGEEQVIEEIAYTWFNRFTALQFMDLNDFNPVKVLINVEGKTRPEILGNAISGIFDENYIPKNTQFKINALLNGQILSKDPEKEVYRLLIVSFCNSLHSSMPFLFERIDDFTELLLPDDLLSKTSIITKLQSAMTHENCKDVEVIGWLYQFYISEKKDKVFESLKKNKKIIPENIPAATQLFTPHWIVKYLVQNSLGRLWMLNNPDSNLKSEMEYYIPSIETETDFLKVKIPEEIKICDPACGSGHMLTYSFDLLYSIYEEEGYDIDIIPELILKNNLYGIELDKRAGELSALALVMKARLKKKKSLKNSIQPNICTLENIKFEKNEINEYMDVVGRDLFTDKLLTTLRQFEQSNNYGSLIEPSLKDLNHTKELLLQKDISSNLFLNATHQKVLKVIRYVDYLRQKYHVVVANPPYMGSQKMNVNLSKFATKNYQNSKSDLFAMFLERALNMNIKGGIMAMISMQSWMFSSTYEKLRNKIISNFTLLSMAHIGTKGFDSIGGEVVSTTAFIIQNEYINNYQGIYVRLIEGKSELEKSNLMKEVIKNKGSNYLFKQSLNTFKIIPGSPIAYFASDKIKKLFNNKEIGDIASTRLGMATADNDQFLRIWYEVSFDQFNQKSSSREEANKSMKKWFPYQKGGKYRKWGGNREYVVNWENDGKKIQEFKDPKTGKIRSHNYNLDYIFKKGVTWNALSSGKTSARLSEYSIFDNAGSSLFPSRNISSECIMAFINSKVMLKIFPLISPSLNYQPGEIAKLPGKFDDFLQEKINPLVIKMIELSNEDWDDYETSWGFKRNQLISAEFKSLYIKKSYDILRKKWQNNVNELMSLELKNNSIFIGNYDLQDEIVEDIPISDITLNCNPSYRFSEKYSNIQQEEKLCTSTIKDFISYSVGCMFGRYSLEEAGLILAKQGDTLKDYLIRVPNPSFIPDDDNVIPVLNLDWFEDDITERFIKFLRITFGEENFEENMRFIENSIGKTIRNYFINDFYKDHVQTYKKRPIYWMISSPKGTFNALIYLHRYHRDNISILLEKYLREFQLKLRAEKNTLERIGMNDNSSKLEKTSSIKEIQKIDSILQELQSWEKDIIFPLASQRIEIDLDDGVKENYLKFGNALKKIAGVN